MTSVWYATREQVQDSMEMSSTPRADRLTDQKIGAASRMIEAMLRRRFYPETKTIKFDWPAYQTGPAWTHYLEDTEFVSLTSVLSGGVDITSSCFLRRSDNRDEPPYDMLQIDLSTSGAFAVGDTFQRSLEVAGVDGYNATDLSAAVGTLAASINGSVSQLTLAPVNSELNVGVGSIAQIGTERLIVTNRRMADTGLIAQDDIEDDTAAGVVTVTDGTLFAAGETILIDSERMYIDEIAGNSLLVSRAWDGTTLAAHDQASAIYARRTFTVLRAALGSTAAAHSQNDSVYTHRFPDLVNELCVAESTVLLEQAASAYARSAGSGADARKSAGEGLDDIRNQARIAYGRERSDAI